ncbi:MAG: (2Fe-2S)-binding protein [Gammaproteobacteria bacterium]|nr:(2Fe-2S)-binding protein [Gammaproteobacteria bacterium]
MPELKINGKLYSFEAEQDTPLLWTIREQVGLTGTKFGCGIASCGACTVLLDGKPVRSCIMPLASALGREITTIEGISSLKYHPVQQAWIELEVPQCGYCQSGQILSAVALLEQNPSPSDDDIDSAMNGNLCRCGTYQRIRKAVHRAAKLSQEGG